MNRIPPSQKIRKKTEELLSQGLDGDADVTSLIVRLGVERLVQEMLEQEVTDYLEREHYQRRRPEQEHRGYRDGYEPGLSWPNIHIRSNAYSSGGMTRSGYWH
jgi:hypothetical protein